MTYKLWLLALAFGACTTANAQKKSSKDSSTVIIFNGGGGSSSYQKKKAAGESNVVKIAPLGLLTGTFPIYYERSITEFLSIQVGGGVTHRNYLRGLFQAEEGPDYTYTGIDENSDQAEGIYLFEKRVPKLGYMASIQPRLYLESEGIEGAFFGFSFDLYKYNFETPGAVMKSGSVVYTGPMKQEGENIRDFMVLWGGQQVFDRLTLEYTTGLGLRSINGTKYAFEINNGNIFEGQAAYKQTKLNFAIGVKVGYHF
jgi:hypothetical protein